MPFPRPEATPPVTNTNLVRSGTTGFDGIRGFGLSEAPGSIVEVNEAICRLRPVEEPALSSQEKKRPKRSARKWGAK